MITVTIEQKRVHPKDAARRRLRISAPTIERALSIAGDNNPDTDVRVVFPIDSDTFFKPTMATMAGSGQDGPTVPSR